MKGPVKRGAGRRLAVLAANPPPAPLPAQDWSAFEAYNALPAGERARALAGLGIEAESPEVLGILTKSHFVIPGKTRFQCQRCGECCRYARKVAQLTYEPCPHLAGDDSCSKHASRYLVCRWFPFWVHQAPGRAPLLTVKPYCSGYGQGPLVDVAAKIAELRGLGAAARREPDGATVIHEVLLIPGRKDWAFPSHRNIDALIAAIRERGGQGHAPPAHLERPGEVAHAHRFTSGLIGAIHDPLLTVDEAGRVSDVNPEACALTGRPRQELLGVPLASLFVDPERVAARMRACFSRGREVASPQRMQLPSGATRPIVLDAVAYRDRTDGLVRGVLVCLSPASAALCAELSQSREYARGLLEASLDALFAIDRDGVVTDVNEAVVAATGRPREALVGAHFASLFLCEDRAREGVRLTFAQGAVRNFELTLASRAGASIPVSFNAAVYKDADGVVQGILAAARDIRERRALMRELSDAQSYARGLIEACLDLMVTIDRAGVVTDANRAAGEMTGLPLDRLIGQPFAALCGDPERAAEGVARTFAEGAVRGYELSLLTASGRALPTVFNASLYRDTAGEVQGVLATARPRD